ncbi:MAG: RagB/SusD family nutrient uptake outer membrane protein [Flavobacteriales bacterium]|nr:RagB/SusD family nutrient uptake outer membrane protein [Flavobacteriales bacterium]
MKVIFLRFTAVLFVLVGTSCSKSFFDIDDNGGSFVINNVKDVQRELDNVYKVFGSSNFYGRNVIAIGDMASDNAIAKSSNSSLLKFNRYSFKDSDGDLLAIWIAGYRLVSQATNIIYGIERIESGVTGPDKVLLDNLHAQALGLRALSNFTLVNIFGYSYSEETKSGLGLVLLRNEASDISGRASIETTYSFIEKDLDEADELFKNIDVKFSGLEFNALAIKTLKARVLMFKHDYEGVIKITAEIMDSNLDLIGNGSTYYDMWGSVSLSTEDVFVIAKDFQSYSSSLNSLYTINKVELSSSLKALFGENDYRTKVLAYEEQDMWNPAKFRGTLESTRDYNIPVFRLSEVYLLSAEAKARIGNSSAIDDLFEVAKRNDDLTLGNIPTAKDSLLKFIAEENRREFYQEGHRLYDMRRTGEIMSDRLDLNMGEFDAQKFVYPIPLIEIQASKIKQNDWLSGMPNNN